ncbi:hypothetical protein SCUP515_06206 [Seiridium cupressi]
MPPSTSYKHAESIRGTGLGPLTKMSNGSSRSRGSSLPTNMDHLASTEQTKSGHNDGSHKRELSKALSNNDWRQRPRGDSVEAFPPFHNVINHVKAKTDSNQGHSHTQKQPHDNTARMRSTSMYNHFRDQENHPPDSNSSLSPPVIIDTFDFAGESDDDGQDAPDGSSHSSKYHSDSLALGMKRFYALDHLLCPALDEGLVHVHSTHSGASQPSTSSSRTGRNNCYFGLATISEDSSRLISEVSQDACLKPIVQVQQVMNPRSLRSKSWNSLNDFISVRGKAKNNEEEHRQQPHMSLATEHELQERKGEASEGQTAAEPHHFEPSVRGRTDQIDRTGGTYSTRGESLQNRLEEDDRYQNMLAKLLKKPANPFAFAPPSTHAALGNRIADPKSEKHCREQPALIPDDISPGKSTISQKFHAFNPKAPEFSSITDHKPRAITNRPRSPTRFARPPLSGLFDQANPASQPSMSMPTGQHWINQPEINNNDRGRGSRTDRLELALHYIEYLRRNPEVPLNEVTTRTIMEMAGLTGSEHQEAPSMAMADRAPFGSINGSAAHQASQLGYVANDNRRAMIAPDSYGARCSAFPGVPSSLFATTTCLTTEPAPIMPHSDLIGQGYTGPYGSHTSHTTTVLPQAATSIPIPFNSLAENTSAQGSVDPSRRVSPLNVSTADAARGGNIGTVLSGIIGPKPVTKPKGPPRPHDPSWTQQQQAYEQYLEFQRMVNPEYHRECRDRQARRAERKKRESLQGQYKVPEKKSAAIEIKKPDEIGSKQEDNAEEIIRAGGSDGAKA